VTAAHDRKFFDTFMLIVGALVALTIVLIILARVVSRNPVEATREADADYQKEVVARIGPVAKVAIAGQDNSALAPPPPAAAPAAAAADLGGEEVFNQACVACHGAGVAGAPKFGDKAAWAPRIAEGIDTLHKHALGGFQGKNGFMPPKGGRTDLTDQSVMNAVDYMVSKSK
jgi:cytochrome c5